MTEPLPLKLFANDPAFAVRAKATSEYLNRPIRPYFFARWQVHFNRAKYELEKLKPGT